MSTDTNQTPPTSASNQQTWTSQTLDSSTHIDRVSVKPPPFWKTDPKVWFLQLEAQFVLANITADATKFNYVVSAVDTEILAQVTDILNSPPSANKYNTIKDRLISIYADSSEQRLRRLLSGLELGDKKPSQLLNEMNRLGGSTVPEPLLRTLWMQQLPTHIQSVLTTSSDSIDNLSKMADKIAEIDQHQPRNFTAATCINDDLTETVKQLAREVAELKTSVQRQSDSNRSSRTRTRSRTPNRNRTFGDGYCWYHHNFKEKARKCNAPCKYFHSTNNDNFNAEN